jgi:SsrA-binding protein
MRKVIANNKKAFFDYEILEKYEAGIVLKGSEVKSIRLGRVNLKNSFVKIMKSEAFVFDMHISYLDTINPHFKPDEKEPRKLLLHRKEIDKLIGKIKLAGLTIVPLSLYFNEKNLAKVEIGLAKGKNVADKRASIKEKDLKREAAIAMKR